MNPIARLVNRVKRARVPRRNLRVERHGGYPAPGPDLPVESFMPELAHEERLSRALGWVATLGQESVDEATGHPLDNLVNAQSADWRRRIEQQFQAYAARAKSSRRQARALREQYRTLNDHDLLRLGAASRAVEEAMLALSGEPVQRPPVISDGGADEDGAPPGRQRRERADTNQQAALTGRAAMAPTRVSQTELRQILDPADARRVPHWQETGFRDPALLGGRPRGAYLHVLALLLAAGADLGAFTQVVELALPEQSNWVIYLVVGGLTAVVLYIAHMIGVMLREAKAKYAPGTGSGLKVRSWLAIRATVTGCALAWAAVGALAYWVRMTVPLIGTAQVGGSGIGAGIGAGAGTSATTASGTYTPQSAAIFLALYVCTGIVAAMGAYFTHNPYHSRYTTAARAYRKASEQAAASRYQFLQAQALFDRQQAEIGAAPFILEHALAQEEAFAEQLKQSIRLQIASMAKDPAVTDAIFSPDQKPYWGGGTQPPAQLDS